MTSPFRLAPPSPREHEWLERPRMLEMLDGRFHRRVTVLRAGAGFGKTLALAQAIASNGDGSAGIDRWLACSPRDTRSGELAAGLCAAVGAPADPGDALGAVRDAIWQQSPRDVALVLDDLHHLGEGGPPVDLLRGLLEALPENGHLVLSTRTDPPLPLARLIASGDALVLDETDLGFDPEERSAFLALRGVREGGVELAGGELPGWPAILELAARAKAEVIDAYLWEEILAGLAPAHRRGLARLADLDWIDADRIEAFTGEPREVRVFVSGLPLTTVDARGAARLHNLWTSVLSRVDREWTPEEFGRGVDHLVDGGHYQEAVELCLRNGREEALAGVLSRLVLEGWDLVSAQTLRTLLATLPAPLRSSPTGRLLEGLYRIHTDPSSAAPYLEAACEGFARSDDPESELRALMARGQLAFVQVDAEAATRVARRAAELPIPAAREADLVHRAVACTLESRPQEALELLDEAKRLGFTTRGQEAALEAVALLDAGQPERAIVAIDAALPGASPFPAHSLRFSRFDACWLAGETDASDLEPFDGVTAQDGGHAHNAATLLSVLACQNASLGRRAVARQQLDRAIALVDRSLGPRADMAHAVAKMFVLAAEGHAEAARRAIEDALDALPDATLVHRHSLRGAALASILSPRARARCATWRIGPCYAPGVQAAEALLAYRENGDLALAAALPWESHRRFRVALVPAHLLELAVVASAAGAGAARALVEELALDHRETVRSLASAPVPEVAQVAAELLLRVPARPAGQLELRVLGELELVRDGAVVQEPVLRRTRVRSLLQYLVAHGPSRRDAICAALWPQHDVRGAANNLASRSDTSSGSWSPIAGPGIPRTSCRKSGIICGCASAKPSRSMPRASRPTSTRPRRPRWPDPRSSPSSATSRGSRATAATTWPTPSSRAGESTSARGSARASSPRHCAPPPCASARRSSIGPSAGRAARSPRTSSRRPRAACRRSSTCAAAIVSPPARRSPRASARSPPRASAPSPTPSAWRSASASGAEPPGGAPTIVAARPPGRCEPR